MNHADGDLQRLDCNRPRPDRRRSTSAVAKQTFRVTEMTPESCLRAVRRGQLLGMLTMEFVGMTRLSLKLAFSRRARCSDSVRSWPGVSASMVMSSILPGWKAFLRAEPLR